MSSKLRKVFDCPTLPHQKLQNPLNYYMQLALAQAYQASLLNEVPVGACLVIPATENEEEKVVLGHNQPITQHDPCLLYTSPSPRDA
jgi:tRNA(Arg) A34 adenosine deaminase TadA